MRLQHLRRPLAWGLALYVAGLCALWRAGTFRVVPPAALAAWAGRRDAAFDGVLLSGVTHKRPGDRYWLRVEAAGGLPVPPAKVLLYLRRGATQGPELRPGQRLRLSGRLRRPILARNPGDFDEASFLDMRGAGLVLHAREVRVLAPSPRLWRPWAWGESVHLSLERWLSARLDPVRATLLEGLVLGYRGVLPRDVERDLRRSGVVWLLTPSGDKVTAVLAAALCLAGALRLGRGARDALLAAAAGAFLLVAIPDPSHTRPALMAAAALAARRLDRPPDPFQAWLLAAWATLLWEPRQLFNAGFALSYGALLAMIVVLPRWGAPEGWPRALRALWGVLALQLVLETALTPALAAFFGSFSPAAALAAPLAVPAAAAGAACVWAGWLVSLLPPPLSSLDAAAARGAGWVAAGFLRLIAAAARLPGAEVETAGLGAAGLAVYALAAAALFSLPDRVLCRRLAVAALAAGALVCGGRLLARPRLSVLVLDGRRGGAALATLPDGRRLLLGGRVPPAALRRALVATGGGALGPPGPAEAALGGARFVWREGGLVAAFGGKEVYCVRSGPAPLPCPRSATVLTRRAGAVELDTDGRHISLDVFRRRPVPGGPVP